jgi:3-deoxy-D-manno-octulosonic-acid transferase
MILFYVFRVCDSLCFSLINVFYRYFDQYRYFDRLEARFVKYDDSDSESKNIIYLLCDVSRS